MGSGYSGRTRIRVNISDNGAKQIFTDVDNVYASGGTDLRYAMNLARNYFISGQVANWNKPASKFFNCISDGYWSGHSHVKLADQINKTYNIKTFAVGFALGGANNNYKTLAEKVVQKPHYMQKKRLIYLPNLLMQ